MNLFTIPIKNLRRKLLRTAMLILAFSAGITSVVALYYVSSSVGDNLEQKLSAYGANILIRPHSENLNVSYGGFSMGNLSYNVNKLNREDIEYKIRNIGHSNRISSIAPKLLESASIVGRNLALVGVEWEEELKIKNYWFKDGLGTHDILTGSEEHGIDFDDEFGKFDIITGHSIAQLLGLKKNDIIEIEGMSFKVAGVLAPLGNDEDRLIFMDLAMLQELKGKPGETTFIEISALCSGCPIEDIVIQIKEALPEAEVIAMQSVVKQRMFTVDLVKNLLLAVSGVILIIACFMLTVFMMASVAERRSEIGILRSMGYSGVKIFCIFTFEALIIGMISGIFGFWAGYFIAGEILRNMDLVGGAPVNLEILHFMLSVFAVCVISVIASFIPALKAAKTEPASAILRT